MKVFTYFSPIPDLWPVDTQWDLLNIWKRSWRLQGWEPVVLTEDSVKDDPKYSEYVEKIAALPATYGHAYLRATFLRWLAMAHAGGGLMTDYDTINYSFAPRPPSPDKLEILGSPLSAGFAAILGAQDKFQKMFDILVNWKVHPEHDWNSKINPPRPAVSDLRMVFRMLELKTYPKPEWLDWQKDRAEGAIGWGFPGWEKAAMVHYGHELYRNTPRLWPKCDVIEKIRPFMKLPFAAGFPYRKLI